MNISKQREKYIYDNFFENPEPDFQKLVMLKTPEELHYLATIMNWDFQFPIIRWISEQPVCSKATALMIFWQAQPTDFLCYSLKTKSINNDIGIFELKKNIMLKFQQNLYIEADIHYDPKNDMPIDDDIPEFMKNPTSGEESYVYYEQKDIGYRFWTDLHSTLNRIDDRMELFNIAHFINGAAKPENVKLILEHPLCDKGIAVLVYWRLKTSLMAYTATHGLLADIIESINKNKYPEVIAYSPLLDKNIESLNRKAKWSIPDVMKEAV